MRVIILSPEHKVKDVPAILWLHGGGYVLGYPENELALMEKFMEVADCVMVSPDYKLGLEAPYPAALEDAYTTLLWLKANAAKLGARDDQIFVIGGSAGGGLTAAVTIYARDQGEVNIAYQMPLFPMLDDRGITESAKDNDAPMWDSNSNTIAWKLYLGQLYGEEDVPAYAAPARLIDFSNLPPAYSYVGTIEPFYDETRIYFEKMKAAGIGCHLDTYEGGFHGFDEIGVKKPLGKEARGKLFEAFKFATENYFKKQN
jgi:acetyl esterase/lipase